MNVLLSFYSYQFWATDQLFIALKKLSQEEYDAVTASGHGSIRDTLAHYLQVQEGWFSWFDGSKPATEAYSLRLDGEDIPTVEDAEKLWKEIAAKTQACLDKLTDDKLAEEWTAEAGTRTMKLPLGKLMFHVANHQTHTRAQIVSAIRRAGHEPGNYDYLRYAMMGGI